MGSSAPSAVATGVVAPKKKSLAMVDCAASLRAAASAQQQLRQQTANAASSRSALPINSNVRRANIPILPLTLQQRLSVTSALVGRQNGGMQIPLLSPQGMGSMNNGNTVAEFLYQLTKMLTDDNKEIIEWVNGRIEVHDPPRLASDVLHKYFRHSKYASFQRQLNYFGFRKLAGKGKMSPCSYVNDDTTMDLRSLLTIKRKTSAPKGEKVAAQKRTEPGQLKHPAQSMSHVKHAPKRPFDLAVHPVMGFISETNKRIRYENSRTAINGSSLIAANNSVSPQTSANYSVAKGIKHAMQPPPAPAMPAVAKPPSAISSAAAAPKNNVASAPTALQASIPSIASLGDLTSFLDIPGMTPSTSSASFGADYQNFYELSSSLNMSTNSLSGIIDSSGGLNQGNISPSLVSNKSTSTGNLSGTSVANSSSTVNPGAGSHLITRDSSLVDLAMLPYTDTSANGPASMGFVDFPPDLNE
eukprot:CAMPEP_0116038082 /NCGR_PEP_ID=MMETSP0321-20121206/22531_1 /TAXON_ID=163516 /ORGANISM="Leptocylindrus danicus var. danicus, Strain B650" /LENGTH=471 /DNA_ID=CAMNT_0003516597 /DNA_START=346 /DNA_END=1761 /DNA_ORIENTATION=-